MKKIMILANSSSGLYDFRNDLVSELLKKYEVIASLPDDSKVKELSDEGVRVIHTDINRRGMNPIQDLKLYFSYRKLLRKERPDAVLTYTIKPNVYGGYACGRMKIPYIATITGLGTTFQKENLLKKLVVMMYKAGLKKASCVFFQNSENMKIFERNGIRGKDVRLVNGSGVNLDKHSVLEYPSDDGKVRFLYIGRNMKDKGTDELLAAAEHFKDNKDITFKLLGYNDGDYEQILKDHESKGMIELHGFDKDVTKHLKECNAVILPTYHEGMSNVLQEAAASGRPVIATDIPGCREIFEEGITGFGCRPRSAESLIEAIDRFLALTHDERVEMGLKGRKKVEKEFDRQLITEEYAKAVDGLIG
ncbi:MAG: glycosyltransferase family 4 protein [Lachnospiraceae bacterium]|nr:glycosyltransferase family 4 protein [Lachnospiraceae bacterium]